MMAARIHPLGMMAMAQGMAAVGNGIFLPMAMGFGMAMTTLLLDFIRTANKSLILFLI
jgi:hypothetical protein